MRIFAALVAAPLLAGAFAAAAQDAPHAADALPEIDPAAPGYRTPRAGEGFRTTVFGEPVRVEPRERRSLAAWDVGVAVWTPAPDEQRLLPFGSLYFWHRPDSDEFFRGTAVGVYNDLFYARALEPGRPLELVLTFENFTVPFDQGEWVDGNRVGAEELTHGWLRAGVGLGYRRDVAPGAVDNMFAVDLTLEPAYDYFRAGSEASDRFVSPQDGFSLQGRLALRWDALERNLLELAHRGFAIGLDGTLGWRANWEDWGQDGREDGGRARRPRRLTGYALVAGGLPFASERHRLLGSLHAGVGANLDRFSAPRLGGGPGGHEYGAIERPLVPGATIDEYFPRHYALAALEYRYELFFFTYLSLRSTLAWLDRDRRSDGRVHRENDLLPSLGARVTTGFFFDTQLELGYAYGFAVRRPAGRGSHEVVAHVSKEF
jgi:hypothetical protein